MYLQCSYDTLQSENQKLYLNTSMDWRYYKQSITGYISKIASLKAC